MGIKLCHSPENGFTDFNNNEVLCRDCVFYESGDESVGLPDGCNHDVFYDCNGDFIDDLEGQMLECLKTPNYCILFSKK